MKKSTKIIIALLIIITIGGVACFVIRNKKMATKNECIKNCIYSTYYHSYKSSEILSDNNKMVWKFDNRSFETRDECLDYCMATK